MSAREAREVSEASTIITPMNNNSTRKANRTWRNRVKGYTQSINHKNKQLINAFAKGNVKRVHEYIDRGAFLDENSVVSAIKLKNNDIFDIVINKYSYKVRDDHYWERTWHGHEEDGVPNKLDTRVFLSYACAYGTLHMVEKIINIQIRKNICGYNHLPSCKEHVLCLNSLLAACFNNSNGAEIVNFLITNGCKNLINKPIPNGRRQVYNANRRLDRTNDRIYRVEYEIAGHKWTNVMPLDISIVIGNFDLFKILIEAGAYSTSKGGATIRITRWITNQADREKYLQKIAEYPQADDPPPTEDEIVASNFFTS